MDYTSEFINQKPDILNLPIDIKKEVGKLAMPINSKGVEGQVYH